MHYINKIEELFQKQFNEITKFQKQIDSFNEITKSIPKQIRDNINK